MCVNSAALITYCTLLYIFVFKMSKKKKKVLFKKGSDTSAVQGWIKYTALLVRQNISTESHMHVIITSVADQWGKMWNWSVCG